MGNRDDQDELDRALERALAVAAAWVKRPQSERYLGKVLEAADAMATRGWSVPPRALPSQVLEAGTDPDDWFARFYDPMRVGVLEVFLRAELVEWQPLVDQTLAAFRRDEHPLVLVSGLAILDSVMGRADMRRTMNGALHVDEESWGNAHRFVMSASLETAASRLRPVGGGRHWTVEGRDSPSGWMREDALKVLNALCTAGALLPQRLDRPVALPTSKLATHSPPALKLVTPLPAPAPRALPQVMGPVAAPIPLAMPLPPPVDSSVPTLIDDEIGNVFASSRELDDEELLFDDDDSPEATAVTFVPTPAAAVADMAPEHSAPRNVTFAPGPGEGEPTL